MTQKQRRMIARLCERIERLNPNSREIGAGMLATLQAEAAMIKESMK